MNRSAGPEGVTQPDTVFTVSAVRCAGYGQEEVAKAVRAAVDELGGIGRFVSAGETILIKPNMLAARKPEQAVTTHPEVVRQVIRLVKGAGATPLVGDSPAGIGNEGALRSLAEKTGIGKVCAEEGVEFVMFTESHRIPYPDGGVVMSFELTTALDRVDGIISVGKLKTHTFTVLTGAVKNLFGIIPGLKKAEFHLRLKEVDGFSGMLVDLAECVRPRLTVIDAVIGMDGEGPSGGRPLKVGLVLASDNVHALDAHFAHMAGADGDTVPSVRIARSRGLGPADHAHVRVLGDGAGVDHIEDFKLPSTTQRYGGIPHVLGRFVGESVTKKPVFLASRCTRCGQCIEVCPADALVQGDKKPTIDRALCIRCYCCQEACPSRAIVLRRRPLRSLARTAASGLGKRLGR